MHPPHPFHCPWVVLRRGFEDPPDPSSDLAQRSTMHRRHQRAKTRLFAAALTASVLATTPAPAFASDTPSTTADGPRVPLPAPFDDKRYEPTGQDGDGFTAMNGTTASGLAATAKLGTRTPSSCSRPRPRREPGHRHAARQPGQHPDVDASRAQRRRVRRRGPARSSATSGRPCRPEACRSWPRRRRSRRSTSTAPTRSRRRISASTTQPARPPPRTPPPRPTPPRRQRTRTCRSTTPARPTSSRDTRNGMAAVSPSAFSTRASTSATRRCRRPLTADRR